MATRWTLAKYDRTSRIISARFWLSKLFRRSLLLTRCGLLYSPTGMTAATSPETQRRQQDPDTVVRVGGWLFERRTWLPLPLALALLIVPAPETPLSLPLVIAGIGVVALGEALRLWGVHHIGVI